MTVVEEVRAVCKEKKIPVMRLEKDLDFGNGYLNPKKCKDIPAMKLLEIANYLKVSVLRFYGIEKPAPTDGDGLGELDRKLFELIPKLSYDQKMMLLVQIETVLKAQEGRKEP